jgi:hypothetical protein
MDFKNAVNQQLFEFYERDEFRKYKWYGYINRQRADAKMINEFKKKFGPPSETGILMGDWSQRKQMKGCEPTKGKAMRKLFSNNGYKLCLVDEYNTSKKFCGDGQDLVNFRKYKDKLPKKRKRRRGYKDKQLAKQLAKKPDPKELEAKNLEKKKMKEIKKKETKERKEERKKSSYVHRLLGSTILKSKDSKDGNRAGPLTKALYKESGYIPVIVHRDDSASSNIHIKGTCTIFTGKDSIPEYLKRPKKVKDANGKTIKPNNLVIPIVIPIDLPIDIPVDKIKSKSKLSKRNNAIKKENHPRCDKTKRSDTNDEYVVIRTSSKIVPYNTRLELV